MLSEAQDATVNRPSAIKKKNTSAKDVKIKVSFINANIVFAAALDDKIQFRVSRQNKSPHYLSTQLLNSEPRNDLLLLLYG